MIQSRTFVIQRRLVEITGLLHRVKVRCAGIKFSPDRNHQVRVLVVNGFDPAAGIGEPRGIKLMRTPGVLAPVLPVLHDVVEGNGQPAEFVYHVKALLRRLVTLPRLPQAERPFRHQRSLSGQLSVAGNHAIHRRAINKIIIHASADFRPQRRVVIRYSAAVRRRAMSSTSTASCWPGRRRVQS